MKTKAGVAWERVDALRDDDGATNWRPARAIQGHATPGRANSLWSKEPREQDSKASDAPRGGSTTPSELLQELRAYSGYQVTWRIYDLMGQLVVQQNEGLHPTNLLSLLEHPEQHLEALVGSRRGLLLLVVTLSAPETLSERRIVKLYRP